MSKKKVIIIGTEPWSLINFRGELIKSFKDNGYSVLAVSKGLDGAMLEDSLLEQFQSNSISHFVLNFNRGKLAPIRDLILLYKLFNLLNKEKPDFVLAYTIKPVIWSGLAARFARIPFYALITGTGFIFQGTSFFRRVIRFISINLYREALRRSKHVFFQNYENEQIFKSNRIVCSRRHSIVNGSGVDLSKFSLKPLPAEQNGLTFLCVARLLGDKGLREYYRAAQLVKKKYPETKFLLVGPEDSSPDAIDFKEIHLWVRDGSIDYLGEATDVRTHIERCHVYVLPSYHEGLPRSSLEAMAMGRPILTTTASGCRETVVEPANGFKVPVKSVGKLAEKLIWFIENTDKLESMALKSREIAEERFDVHKVNRHITDIIGVTT